MLSLLRGSVQQSARPLTRGLSEVVPHVPKPTDLPMAAGAEGKRGRRRPNVKTADWEERQARKEAKKVAREHADILSGKRRATVREDHGLYAFFRRKPGEDLQGEDRYEVVDTPEDQRIVSGRAWEVSELRNKSFKDLHTLWYVALREKNLLSSQQEEVRRMGVTSHSMQVSTDKTRHCRKTMAGIKMVLTERRIAVEGAIKLAQEQRETLGLSDATEPTPVQPEIVKSDKEDRLRTRAKKAKAKDTGAEA